METGVQACGTPAHWDVSRHLPLFASLLQVGGGAAGGGAKGGGGDTGASQICGFSSSRPEGEARAEGERCRSAEGGDPEEQRREDMKTGKRSFISE